MKFKVQDHLNKETLQKLKSAVPPKPKKTKKTKKQIYREQLTHEDYKFLMDIFKPTYKRKNGRVKRK